MTEAVIVVEELRMRYRGATGYAVDGIAVSVAAGEIFGFLGPNGAGKSTTQRILTGAAARPFRPRRRARRSMTQWGADYYEHIGVGFELPAHFSRLSAGEPGRVHHTLQWTNRGARESR